MFLLGSLFKALDHVTSGAYSKLAANEFEHLANISFLTAGVGSMLFSLIISIYHDLVIKLASMQFKTHKRTKNNKNIKNWTLSSLFH